jgi:hypothetical protein
MLSMRTRTWMLKTLKTLKFKKDSKVTTIFLEIYLSGFYSYVYEIDHWICKMQIREIKLNHLLDL